MTKWTDFLKEYAKKNNTSYGCAMSDPKASAEYKASKPEAVAHTKKMTELKDIGDKLEAKIQDTKLEEYQELTTPMRVFIFIKSGTSASVPADIEKVVNQWKEVDEKVKGLLRVAYPELKVKKASFWSSDLDRAERDENLAELGIEYNRETFYFKKNTLAKLKREVTDIKRLYKRFS